VSVPTEFSKRLEAFLERPELQKVFDEATRLAKTPLSRERLAASRRALKKRCPDETAPPHES
jgi:hypothetical protein